MLICVFLFSVLCCYSFSWWNLHHLTHKYLLCQFIFGQIKSVFFGWRQSKRSTENMSICKFGNTWTAGKQLAHSCWSENMYTFTFLKGTPFYFTQLSFVFPEIEMLLLHVMRAWTYLTVGKLGNVILCPENNFNMSNSAFSEGHCFFLLKCFLVVQLQLLP